ncbi:AAA family ATPase [Sulfolobus sp. SCGC AB-777_G06]|nr:AAA family ATPase [Sulfolobus sp. SCGC AB-777_G06]
MEENIWWRGKDYIEDDIDIKKWNSAKFKWIPKEMDKVSLQPFSLNFIVGPRQSGKTTLIKLLIRRLLELNHHPLSIFYCSCDLVSDYEELLKRIKEYLKTRTQEGIKSSFIFLDEVTFVKDWYRAVKYLIDSGEVMSDVFTVSGSSSLTILKQKESFPGRRGNGTDVVLYPLSFSNYVKVINPRIEIKPGWYGEIEELFQSYIKIGGLPPSINGLSPLKTYIDWIIYEINKVGRDETLAKQILSAILSTTPSKISYNSIAKDIGVNHRTVAEYIKLFNEMFLTLTLHFIDVNTAYFNYKKQIKIHFLDPLFYHAISLWTGVKKPDEPIIVEGVVASHLSRIYNIGYTEVGKEEIDVVTLPEVVGYEVKYRERARQVKAIAGKMKKVITLSKNGENDTVPVYLFLAELNA